MLKTKYNYIYKIVNSVNNKIYVGRHSSNKPPEKDNYLGSGVFIKKAIKKYGKENFKREVLEMCLPCDSHLKYKEKFWIDKLNSLIPNGYNIADNGIGAVSGELNSFYGKSHTKATKEKISLKNKGRKVSEAEKAKLSMRMKGTKMSDSNKQKLIEANTGRNRTEESKKKQSEKRKGRYIGEQNPFYGKKHTEEARKKISEAQTGHKMPEHVKNILVGLATGRPMPEKVKENLRQLKIGKPRSPETIAKFSKSMKGKYVGEKSANFGKPRSDETKAKISKANKGRKPSSESIQRGIETRKRNNLPNPLKGTNISEEHRNKICQNWANKPLLQCPHCGIESINISNLKRYHFDNCKNKPVFSNFEVENEVLEEVLD